MLVSSQLLWAIVCIHAFWFYCFITGTLIRVGSSAPGRNDAPPTARHHMAELVITSATGIAVTGFVLLLLGFLGLLNIFALMFWLALEILLFKLIKHENVFGTAFWKSRLQTIKRAWSLPPLIIYLVFLVLLVPAILPPTLWDSIMYHLAYAVDWAHAGRIYGDEFLRFPYYANNFVLIYALMFVLKVGQLCHFATWLCGLLSGLGIYVLVANHEAGPADAGRWLRIILAVRDILLPLTLALSPVFLNYLNVGYVDVPIGLFVLIPVLCTFLILKGDSRNYEIDLVLAAAFCAGMKITLFLCLPLFALSLIVVLRRQQRRVSHMVALFVLLLMLSAPWYLRNFVVVGDPVHPILNLMVKGTDRVFTKGDQLNQRNDLPTLKDAAPVWLLPVNLFTSTNSNAFREPGTNLSVVLLYLPLVTLCLMLFRSFRRRAGLSFIYLNLAVIYLLINWLGISVAGRYFLHLFPVYLGYLGVCFNLAFNYAQTLAAKQKAMALALQALLVLLLLALPYPSPISNIYYRAKYERHYLDLARSLNDKDLFFRRSLTGYVSTQATIDSLYAKGGQHQRVLAIGGENLSFFFRERNIVNVGDWFGPGRYSDVMTAVDNSTLAEYLSRFNIGAVMVNVTRNPMKPPQYEQFIKQLELSHFELQPRVEAGTVIYLKTSE
jgi:hypothetical protein